MGSSRINGLIIMNRAPLPLPLIKVFRFWYRLRFQCGKSGRILCFLLGALLCLELAQGAQPRVGPTIEGITEYRYDNGLQVLLFPDNSQPKITINVTLFVGSRHEGYGEAGMAHLLEHLAFKGTPTHPNIPQALQQRGAQFNGTTWFDRTNYYETLPASEENLEFAIRLEADRMVNSFISSGDLASEMTVVRNEFEAGENSPSAILRQRMFAVAYEWHNYGKSTIGNQSDIERVPIENLQAFYRRFYQPDNSMLVVAGRFDPEKALGYIEKYFAAIPRPERHLVTPYTEEPTQDGERVVKLRRVGDVGYVGAAYHIPAGGHSQFPAVDVLGALLVTEPAGRLYRALVEKKLATKVYGGAYAFHDPGLIQVFAEVRDRQTLEKVRRVMIDEIEKIGEDGVNEEEVERVKQQLLKQRELSLSNTSSLAIELSEWAAQGDWRLFFLYRDRLEQVTAEAVKALAAKYLQQSNRTVGMFIPTEEPRRAVVAQLTDLADQVKDYRGRESVAAGEAFDTSPSAIEARTSRFQLKGGLKIALLPKRTRGESVDLDLTLRYGTGQSLKGLVAAANILPKVMLRGSEDLSHRAFQDALDEHRVEMGASGKPGEVSFWLKTKKAHLIEAFRLLSDALRRPRLQGDDLEVLRSERLAVLEQSLSNPTQLALLMARRKVSPYPGDHVRYLPTLREELERYRALTIEEVRLLHREFLNGNHGELALVGDFDPEVVRAILESIFDDWISYEAYEWIPEVAGRVERGGEFRIQTPDKANAFFVANHEWAMRDTHVDYPGMVIGNFILGGGSLSSRLGDRVRQKEGLSYGVGTMFLVRESDPRAMLMTYAISNPENTPRVIEVIQEEFELLLEKGITEEELVRAKTGYLQATEVGRAKDGALARQLAASLHHGRTMQFTSEMEEKIRNLTVDDVNQALRNHVDTSRFIVVAAGDFKTKESDDQ